MCTLQGVRLEETGVRGSARSLGVKALSWADPERSRSWPLEPVHYNCPLVDHLNADLSSRQVGGITMPRGEMTSSYCGAGRESEPIG